MGTFKAVGYPEDVGLFTDLKTIKVIHGPPMDDIQPTRRAGGAVRIRLLYLIIPSYITEKFLLMMQTAVLRDVRL